MAEVKLIKMKRGGNQKPFTADVHPDEVEGFLAGGWELAKRKETDTGSGKPKAKGKK